MLEIITGENIEKLRELAHKDSVNECVEWLIEHYHMVGEEVVKLQDENKKLKKQNTEVGDLAETLEVENEELKHENTKLKLENENEELKVKFEYEKELYDNCRTKYTELNKENEELKEEIETMKIMGINCIGGLVKQNEELKDQLRTIQAMDKEEPCEQVERLLNSVKTLTTKCHTLYEKNESVQEELLIEKQRSAMLSASFATLEYERNISEGEVKQANKTIEQLLEVIK